MLQEVVALGALALDSIKSLRLTRNNRPIIARGLGVLHRELSVLISNGDKILRSLKRHNNGKAIDLGILGQLIEDQRVIIRRINAELRRPKMRTALSLHAPQLEPLQVLLEGKSVRIELLRERVRPGRRHFEVLPPTWLRRGFGRVQLPDNPSIAQARRELRKIKAQVEELREFIVENFEVHEVV